MPHYLVRSGDYEYKIKRDSPNIAAFDAIGMLQHKLSDNIRLSLMTCVCIVGREHCEEEFFYVSTVALIDGNGLTYKSVS